MVMSLQTERLGNTTFRKANTFFSRNMFLPIVLRCPTMNSHNFLTELCSLLCLGLVCFVCCEAGEISSNAITSKLRPCYKNHSTNEGRRRIVYPDNSEHPVLVPYLGWASGQISGVIAYHLLTEVMEYESNLIDMPSLLDDEAVNSVAGCLDLDDDTCSRRDTEKPTIHFTIESWMMGIRRAAELPHDVKPFILGSSDFSVDDSYFIKSSIFKEGTTGESPVFLDDYRFYNAQRFKPHVFFDKWERMLDLIPQNVIVRCSSNPAFSHDLHNTCHYTTVTGDADVSCSHNDSIWFSPACRANKSECVPTLIQYSMENAMQLAFFHNLPLAIMMVDAGTHSYKEFYSAVTQGRFLFSHWAPMNVLLDEAGNFPILLNFPRTNLQQHIAGIFKTGISNIKPQNYCWRELPRLDQQVAFFASKLSFFDDDMEQMMLRSGNLLRQGSDNLAAVATTACEWIQTHEDRWRAWIPAKCDAGSYVDSTMIACAACPAGSFCAGGFGQPVPCPENHFCPVASRSPQHCPHGMGTLEEGAPAELNCTVCPQGYFKVSRDCISVVVPICAFFGIAVVLGVAAYYHHKMQQDARWFLKSSEVLIVEPQVVLGRGTQGLVVKGTYRGTEVAIKRFDAHKVCTEPSARFSLGFGILNLAATRKSDSDIENLANDSASTASYSTSARESYFISKRNALKRDLMILTSIRHPCISAVLGVVNLRIDHRSELCLVMELMELGSLGDLLNNRMYPLDGEQVLQFLQNIAQGMLFLHSASPPILHKDLTSQNVLVDRSFNAKISDIQMGALRSSTSSQSRLSSAPASPTGKGRRMSGCGKESFHQSIFRAPESACGEYGTFSDVYSFGLIVYECLTRTASEANDSCLYSSLKTASDLPDPLGSSQEVATLIRDCLRSDPSRRPPFQELHRRLSALGIEHMTSAVFSQGEASRSSSAIAAPNGLFRNDSATLNKVKSKLAHRNSVDIVHSLFPPHVVEALILGEKIPPEPKGMVTMFFSDIVGFTTLSSSLPAEQVSQMLNRWFDTLDVLTDRFGVYKLETIGDAFLCATNIVKEQPDHAARMARFSLAVVKAAEQTLINAMDPSLGYLQIRVGINSGPCMATVIGRRNPKYTLFGDTINVASRMESTSLPGCVQCSQATADLIRVQDPAIRLVDRGQLSVKGKGAMETYWIQEAGSHSGLEHGDSRLSLAAEVKVPCWDERRAEAEAADLEFNI